MIGRLVLDHRAACAAQIPAALDRARQRKAETRLREKASPAHQKVLDLLDDAMDGRIHLTEGNLRTLEAHLDGTEEQP